MKKVLGFVFASLMLVTASASELWWTIEDGTGGTATVDDSEVTWTSAKLYANTTGQNYGTKNLISTISQEQIADIGMASSTLGSYTSGYSFFVELYNGNNLVGKSYVTKSPKLGAVAYATLTGNGNVFQNSFETPATTPYSFEDFTMADIVPEPTSGLLVLIGALALGLKRKKEIV